MPKDKTVMVITGFSVIVIIVGLQGIAVQKSVLAATSSDMSNNVATYDSKNIQNNILFTNILARNLENHIQKAGAILEVTSKLPQVRNMSYANLLNQTLKTLHGIPQYADKEKRQVAKNIIISSNSDLYKIYFIMPNGDMYFLEPYSTQQTLTKNNYAFRDYFQGAIKRNDTYLGNVIIATAASHPREAVIAVPVYSLKDNSTIVGVWAGSIDFNILDKELQSLNITSSSDVGGNGNNNTRIVYLDSKGQKIADSDINKSSESFANLNSVKNAINGQAGSITDIVDNNTKMLVTYQPVKVFHNTWVVLLMQPIPPQPRQ
ncbi:MAG TPA: cache domain-containing protein [Nitrososphaeraceae archaeon]|nr:cache domain-containing protein [Nitrososphaeraceae archaeon]